MCMYTYNYIFSGYYVAMETGNIICIMAKICFQQLRMYSNFATDNNHIKQTELSN